MEARKTTRTPCRAMRGVRRLLCGQFGAMGEAPPEGAGRSRFRHRRPGSRFFAATGSIFAAQLLVDADSRDFPEHRSEITVHGGLLVVDRIVAPGAGCSLAVITSIFCRTNASPGTGTYLKSRRAGREREGPQRAPR